MEDIKMYDSVVIGGGPGGMNAALYMARMGMDVLSIEGGLYGGQMNNTEEVDNYLGVDAVLGADLSDQMYTHMTRFVHDELNDMVEKITNYKDFYILTTMGGEIIKTKTVVVATGSKHRELGIPGEQEYSGRGVSYCAVCDGAFFRNKEVVVIGGGNSALEEALYLSNIVGHVTIVHRRDELRADKVYQDRAFAKDNISFEWSQIPLEIKGDDRSVNSVILKSTKDDTIKELPTSAVFIYVGMDPVVPEFDTYEELKTTPQGFIKTDNTMATNLKGIYAIGDVRDTDLRQIVTAAGDGAIVSKTASEYIQGV